MVCIQKTMNIIFCVILSCLVGVILGEIQNLDCELYCADIILLLIQVKVENMRVIWDK